MLLNRQSSEHQQEDILRKILEELCETRKLQEKSFAQILEELESNTTLLQQIAEDLTPEPTTASIAIQFSGETVMANNALVFNVGQTSTGTIVPLLADGITASGGVLSNVVITFSDPSATFVLNADNTSTWTAVAASTGAISGSVACTVTDSDGVVSTWTQAFTVTTNATTPPPQQLTQSIAMQFSTPTP